MSMEPLLLPTSSTRFLLLFLTYSNWPKQVMETKYSFSACIDIKGPVSSCKETLVHEECL